MLKNFYIIFWYGTFISNCNGMTEYILLYNSSLSYKKKIAINIDQHCVVF